MKSNQLLLFPVLAFLLFALHPSPVLAKSQKAINHVRTSQKIVALTFDADMNPKMLRELQDRKVDSWYDEAIIDELTADKVPTTLFLTGMWIETYATTTTELSNNPLFEIGNHSYSHPGFSTPCYKLATTTESSDAYQISKTDQLLSQYASHYTKLFRFPGLCYDADDIAATKKAGYSVIGGDVLGGDGFQMSADSIVSNVVNKVRPGSIVVLHMMGGPNAPKTSEALPVIIQTLKKEGYVFVTVSDLLKLKKKK
jgi:peptidoglycan/xylan/chitin deacetylase (PgdA/CDA1 family)